MMLVGGVLLFQLPKGQLLGLKKHLKKLLLFLLLFPQKNRLKKEAVSSLQTFFRFLKHFVMENFKRIQSREKVK